MWVGLVVRRLQEDGMEGEKEEVPKPADVYSSQEAGMSGREASGVWGLGCWRTHGRFQLGPAQHSR